MTAKKLFIDNACHLCNKHNFSQKAKLRRHLSVIHHVSLPSGTKRLAAMPPPDAIFVDNREDADMIMYACPSCTVYFESLVKIKHHVNDTHLQQNPSSPIVNQHHSESQDTNEDEASSPSSSLVITDSLASKESSTGEEQTDLLYFSQLETGRYLPKPPVGQYCINDFDVCNGFYQFQQSITITKHSLLMESHVHHILAMSSILLVKPDRMHPDVVRVFGRENIRLLQEHLRYNFGFGYYGDQFDVELLHSLKNTVTKVRYQRMTRFDACLELWVMAKSASAINRKIIKSIARLIDELPEEDISAEIKEQELCTRYLAPAIQPLLDDPENNVYFRWTGTTNDDAKALPKGTISAGRPDAMMSCLEGVQYKMTIGFAEVKPATESDNNYAIAKDLIRLGRFSKNAIDHSNLEACLSMQSVGRTTTFYLTKLMSDGLYIMMELATLTMPSSLSNLTQYLIQLDDVVKVLTIVKEYCKVVPHDELEVFTTRKRPTSSDQNIHHVLSPTRDRKRPCATRHNFVA